MSRNHPDVLCAACVASHKATVGKSSASGIQSLELKMMIL